MRRSVTEAPPSRWRVVERGRRLEVIDRQTGERLAGSPAAEPIGTAPTRRRWRWQLLRQTRFDGGAELTTHWLFDRKAPRTIELDPGSAAAVRRVQLGLVAAAILFGTAVVARLWLFALPLVLLNRAARQSIRDRITAWLDQVEREGR